MKEFTLGSAIGLGICIIVEVILSRKSMPLK